MQSVCAIARLQTPIGLVELTANDAVLTGVRIDPGDKGPDYTPPGHVLLATATAQVNGWFEGQRQGFDLPLMPLSTPRGETLRAAIQAIAYGETLTYAALALTIGSASRAVGQACRRNPFPIIIPCHRVISSGTTEHYSGGDGPRTKAWLIAFEQGRAYRYGSDQLF